MTKSTDRPLTATEAVEAMRRDDAIKELEAMIEESQRESDRFYRKAKAAMWAHHFGIPHRLYKAVENLFYGDADERKFAGRMLGAWCRGVKG